MQHLQNVDRVRRHSLEDGRAPSLFFIYISIKFLISVFLLVYPRLLQLTIRNDKTATTLSTEMAPKPTSTAGKAPVGSKAPAKPTTEGKKKPAASDE
jgi:hypothetical protein